jgi:hypothetical protein
LNIKENQKIKKEDYKIPILKVVETFKEEQWLIGEKQILDFLEKNKLISLSVFKKESPWTQQGLEQVTIISENIEYLFKYPKVF